ncbi:MAG: PAS domain-containing protein [Pirellulaceae bacterium]|nr:PAS domain-containing protein [Pirellulaceae bacterium]
MDRISVSIGLITAIISSATLIALLKVAPQALALPSLSHVNRHLQEEIEKREQAETELRESKERLVLAVAGTDDGLWDWNIATDEVWYAPRFAQLLGFDPEDFPGDLSSFSTRLHPEDEAGTWAAVDRHLKDGESYDVEYRLRMHDGSYRWFRGRGAATRDETGKPTRMSGSIHDITEKKASATLLQGVIDHADAAITVKDCDGRYQLVNKYFKDNFAVTDVEVLGQTDTWVRDSDVEPIRAADREVIASGGTVQAEESFDENGHEKIYLTTQFPILGPDGETVAIGGISTDVTELRQTSNQLRDTVCQLEQRNKELDQFAYVASHDLRAPLRGVAQLASWIEEDCGETVNDATAKNFRTLHGRIRRLETLLNDLLEYSRVGQEAEEAERVDVRDLIAVVIETIALPADFSLIVAKDLPVVETQRAPLELVFRNLIGNAIKHHDSHQGTISVSVQDAGKNYRFSVSDDGPGIDSRFHERVFQMFETLQSRDKVEGSGMGLAMIRKTVEAHGGTIELHSSPGAGATFTFTWPKQARIRSQ